MIVDQKWAKGRSVSMVGRAWAIGQLGSIFNENNDVGVGWFQYGGWSKVGY